MANTPTPLCQLDGVNFKCTIFNVALTGNYAAPETFTLTTATANPNAVTFTGPAGAAKFQPDLDLVNLPTVMGFNLVPTATAGQYTLALYTATGAAFSGAYPANAAAIIKIYHGLQGL